MRGGLRGDAPEGGGNSAPTAAAAAWTSAATSAVDIERTGNG
jgi:hypothetical protein